MNEEKIKEIGKTSATDRDPNTSDKFTFWLAPEVIVNPFDIVEVEQVSHEGKSKRTYFRVLPSFLPSKFCNINF